MPTYRPRAVVKIDALFKSIVEATRFASWEAIPRRVEWQRNDARHADKAKITLLYRDFPLDPRMLSTVHVQVFVADVGGTDVAGNERPLELSPANLRFQGYVDVPEVSLSNDMTEVTFDCRDYTALYLDKPWRSIADEDLIEEYPKPVSRVVRGGNLVYSRFAPVPKGAPAAPGGRNTRIRIPETLTLEQFVEMVRSRVNPLPPAKRPPTLFDDPALQTRNVAAVVGRNNLTMQGEDNAWDVLTKVCELFGQIPTWDLDPVIGPVLYIRRASTFSSLVNYAELNFGTNVRRLTYRRNLTAPERRAVSVVAWNPRRGQVIQGLAPPAGEAEGEVIYPQGVKQSVQIRSEVRRVQYLVEGDFNQRDVDDIALAIFYGQSQRRIEGTVETVNMTDTVGGNVLRLKNADRLVVRIGSDVVAGTLHLSDSAAAAYLSDPDRPNSVSPEVALTLVQALRQVERLEVEFFVLEARHIWDSSTGYEVSVDFQDFLFDALRQNPDRVFRT